MPPLIQFSNSLHSCLVLRTAIWDKRTITDIEDFIQLTLFQLSLLSYLTNLSLQEQTTDSQHLKLEKFNILKSLLEMKLIWTAGIISLP